MKAINVKAVKMLDIYEKEQLGISSNQLKTMKSKQLRGIIREALLEVLNEIGQTPGHGAVKVKKGDPTKFSRTYETHYQSA